MVNTGRNKKLVQFQDMRNKLAVILNDLAKIAKERNDIYLDISENTKTPSYEMLSKRGETVKSGEPFRVAVVGEFSRGKSTLINALLGKEVLTTDFRPNTATKTLLKYGKDERFKVKYRNDHPDTEVKTADLQMNLAKFTSDTTIEKGINDNENSLKNPDNSLAEQIYEVEVWCDSEFLKTNEMEIIDTPGLGSVFKAHKKVTYEVIPYVDATLFLIQVDPGPSASEILFLKFVREHVEQIFFVLTKVDNFGDPSQLDEMVEYVRETIENGATIHVKNLYPISATRALRGEDGSGFGDFQPALTDFLVKSSGLARLKSPCDLANTFIERLSTSVDHDLTALNRNLTTLEKELERLSYEEENIKKKQETLLKNIDLCMNNIIEDATEGINNLPDIMRRNTEDAIENCKIKEIGDTIQVAIKDSIVKWQDDKFKKLETSYKLLHVQIEDSLYDILSTIDINKKIKTKTDLIEIEINPSLIPGGMKEAGKYLGKTVLNVGWGGAAGGGGGLLVSALGTSLIALPAITLPIIGAVIPIALAALSFRRRVNQRIKEKLLEPVPGSDLNTYWAIVEGCPQENGDDIPGIRKGIIETFEDMGNRLKDSIIEVVTDNLENRIDQLKRQIEDKKHGEERQQQDYDKYLNQQLSLKKLKDRLAETSTIIRQLND